MLAHEQFPLWVLCGLVIPAVLGGVITWSWMGVLLGFLWGGLVRILVVHHITWSVNSVCHLWGRQPFQTHDESRNNVLVGLLAMGEGWHNKHHAFPTSARHGLRWWELDVSYLFIQSLAAVGLASNVLRPDQARIASKKRGAEGQERRSAEADGHSHNPHAPHAPSHGVIAVAPRLAGKRKAEGEED